MRAGPGLTALIAALLLAAALSGCSSSTRQASPAAQGSFTYGTGPNNTRPRPQTSKVDVSGVGGATVRYEKQKPGGTNKDYTVLGQNYQVWRGARSYIEEGTASWYGPGFNGKKTSLGEIYNQKGYSAAHKNLPLPCYLLVTNLANGRKIIVRVNDRGPFHGSRIIDLSEGAARHLNITARGTAKVRIELIDVTPGNVLANAVGTPKYGPVKNPSPGVNYTDGKNYVQLVSNNNYGKAVEVMRYVRSKISLPVRVVREGSVNRVLVGPLNEAQIPSVVDKMKKLGFADCFSKKI